MQIISKRALVVGGASGLARATAEMLVNAGASVAILDLPTSPGAQVAAALGRNTCFIPCDISDHEGTEAAVHAAAAALGGVDLGINVAGGGAGPRRVVNAEGPYPLAQFQHVVQLNLVASFNLSRLEADYMRRSTPNSDGERGVIINTSSNVAFGGPSGLVPYAATKAGVAGLSLTMARDLAPYGIRVLAIAPSMFETGLLRQLTDSRKTKLLSESVFPKRMGQPLEFAHLVKAIIENSMLNGDTLRLDGGTRRAIRDDLNDVLF